MKVLFLNLGVYSRLGGIEQFNRRIVRCLDELHGCLISEAAVISVWDAPEHIPPHFAGMKFVPGAHSKMRSFIAFIHAVRSIRPDIILYGHVVLSPFMIVARVVNPSIKNVLFVHGYEVWNDPLRPIPEWERRIVRKMADVIVSVSGFTRDRMAEAYDLEPKRFRVLPPAVDVLTQPKGDATWPPVLLSVGRLTERYKGFDNVIMALPKVARRFPEVRYRIVGPGPLPRQLSELIQQVGVDDKVDLLGQLTDVELTAAYRSASIFILPSRKEGFGIVFLEAWAHGLPVIGGRIGASAEVITDGVNGLLVNPESLEEIAGAAIRLLADRNLACELGRRGYETVLKNYTHDHFRERLGTILKELG